MPTACVGEDGINYRTLRGTWKGTEVDVTPGSTDYDLNGPITVNRVEWTRRRIHVYSVIGQTSSRYHLKAYPKGKLRRYVPPAIFDKQIRKTSQLAA